MTTPGRTTPTTWTTRAKYGDADRAAIRDVLLAAFPSAAEADLVDSLRADAAASAATRC